jgi:SAM-dependent methyltransferase
MGALVDMMDQVFYPDFGHRWDDLIFRDLVLENLTNDKDLLDLGAGAGIVPQMSFRGRAKMVCGVDPDERVMENPFLDEAKVGMGDAIPYPDRRFDVVIADNVLEHLDDPERVFREIARVLRPGGLFLSKTPNALHYVPIMAKFTPQWFHEWFNRLRGRQEVDTFPTLYRANTEEDLVSLAGVTGFGVKRISLVEGRPEYLRISAPTYCCGIAYERLVNSSDLFRNLRVVLMAQLERR